MTLSHANTYCRPFSVHPIPSSNLILLVYDNLCTRTDPHYKLRIAPKEKEYSNESLACHRSGLNMKRRRPTECISRHANVSEGEGGRSFIQMIYKPS